MLRILDVPLDWVRSGDTARFEQVLGEASPADARELQGSITVTFKALEIPDRSIYDSPGVLAYIHKLHERIPHLFYFLVPSPLAGAIESFVRSLLETSPIAGEQVQLPSEVVDALMLHLENAARYATTVGDDWRPIIAALVDGVGDSRERMIAELEVRLWSNDAQ